MYLHYVGETNKIKNKISGDGPGEKLNSVMDGTFFCYCAYVLRTSRRSKKLLKDTAYYNKLDIFAQFITTRVKQKQSLEGNYVNDVCPKCRLN